MAIQAKKIRLAFDCARSKITRVKVFHSEIEQFQSVLSEKYTNHSSGFFTTSELTEVYTQFLAGIFEEKARVLQWQFFKSSVERDRSIFLFIRSTSWPRA